MSTEIVSQKYNRFPDSDGQPIADNTLQLKWIVMLYTNIDWLYDGHPDVFVASDNLIYPDPTDDRICLAPDVYVAYGRPKQGERGSYKVWQEGDIFPQVIFEVLSPRNTKKQMIAKRDWCEAHGCEEYLQINPKTEQLSAWARSPQLDKLVAQTLTPDWMSPRLQVRFVQSANQLMIEYPDGAPFLPPNEVRRERLAEKQRAEAETQRADSAEDRANRAEDRADSAEDRADSAEARADAEQLRREQLAAKLRELGIDPDSI